MKQIKVLAVLPYAGMKEMIISAAEEYSEISLQAYVGDLKKGVEIVRKQKNLMDCDLVISRGGTAEMLKKEFEDLPVLEIPISFEDVFRSILLAKNYQEKFAIVSFPAIASRAKELCDLLQYDIEVYTIRSTEEAKKLLLELRQKGCTMVVGDMTTATAAKNLGMNAVLIMSGRDSVNATLNQAKLFFSMRKKETAEFERMKWAVMSSPQLILIFDENRQLVYNNIDQEDGEEDYIAFARDNLDVMLKHDTYHTECQLGNTVFLIEAICHQTENGREVIVYGRKVYKEPIIKQSGILLADDSDDGYAFESPFGVTNSIGQAREAIMRCAESRLPVLILGEPGTGKDAAASSIYHLGYNNTKPRYIIDCELVNNKEWNDFFEKTSSPLLDVNCTIYFKNIHAISGANEKKMRDLIEHTNLCKRNQVIFSAEVKRGEEKCQLAEYILANVKCFLLQALPIRQRKEDVTSLSVIYLGNLNAEFGKQIIGFEPGAEEVLLQYQWPGNVTQLKRVLRELVIKTDGCYITKKDVAECIRNEVFVSEETAIGNIDLNQTLDDITYDVIRMVLKRENMNQKKAAEKLNVSRSTIWRVLKSHT